MSSADKDLRFMAVSDLLSEMAKDTFRLDRYESKVSDALLKLLEDTNGEVQNLTLRCFPLLVSKVSDAALSAVVKSLLASLGAKEEHVRDLSALGLKSIVSSLPLGGAATPAVVTLMADTLLVYINKDNREGVIFESLDILGDLVARFGFLLEKANGNIRDAALRQLKHTRVGIRKRALSVIATIAPTIANNDEQLIALVCYFIDSIAANPKGQANRTYIQTLAGVIRGVHGKMEPFTSKIAPLLMSSLALDDDELREASLQVTGCCWWWWWYFFALTTLLADDGGVG